MFFKVVVLFLVLSISSEVFSRLLDSRNYYDVTYTGDQHFAEEGEQIQYDIVLGKDGQRAEDPLNEVLQQPVLKKKINNKGKTLCVGSVTLMAICY